MTSPKHARQTFDRFEDEEDALRSLSSHDLSSILPQVIDEDDEPLTTVLPRESEIATTYLGETDKAITTPQETVEQPKLKRNPRQRRVQEDDSRTLRRDPQYLRDRHEQIEGTRRAARTVQPVQQPVPSQPYDEEPLGSTASRRPAVARRARRVPFIFTLVMVLSRLAAIALCALVVLLAIPQLGARLKLLEVATVVSSFMPSVLSGVLVIASPFGGAFRGDFAIAALILFIIDWLCSYARASSRWPYGR